MAGGAPFDSASLRSGRTEGLAREEVAPGVHRLPLPLRFEVGPVNAYLIRGEEPILIDAGPRTDEAWATLDAHFRATGFDPRTLRHIVLSHQHVDHDGNARRLAELAPGARVWVHEADAGAVFEHEDHMRSKAEEVRRLVRFWGFPESTVETMVAGYLSFGRFAEGFGRERFSPIRGERQEIAAGAVAGARLEAIHCPGHTEGLVCVLMAGTGTGAKGVLFASDHILERITPNPAVYVPPYRGRRSGLADYIESLRRVRDLDVAMVLPGHGRAFPGLAKRVDEILDHHRHRKRKVLEKLRARGPATILELVHEVWPDLDFASWYLACREIEGHLDLLIEEALVREAADGTGVARFAP